MIGYPITEEELWSRIRSLKPNWRSRARKRTTKFREAGRYNERTGIWSEIKPVYMEVQHSKCAYCEKPLSRGSASRIEHDVEHYRPKSQVSTYPPRGLERDERSSIEYDFSVGDSSDLGYHLLAYHPLNYLGCCKTCNTSYKLDYFPIASTRIMGSNDLEVLKAEQPFLIYPIGDLDEPPESLIGFDGIAAIPIGKSPTQIRRAEVTIDFFQLNNRDDLRPGRAEVIDGLYESLQYRLDLRKGERRKEVTQRINRLLSDKAPHANCARCFARTFQTNPDRASQIAQEVKEYLESLS